MRCRNIQFSSHAIQRMFERGLSESAVREAVRRGTVIADYPDDRPYPSQLLLSFMKETPLHAVVATNPEDDDCIVVTAYVPSLDSWELDFKTRKTK